ncbi:hypothetical protein V5O48_006239 [Marasmius crinis-equi]|uniref:Uncharacterized protein n=1 Tax=Marasmius crinis-equi TaxID=585013 RepID=A0ABR3FK89_9AGAR
MGFRSSIRQSVQRYVQSLSARRNRKIIPSSSLPPPTTTPGTPLSPIAEESPRLQPEGGLAPEAHVAYDEVTTPSSHAERPSPRSVDDQNNRSDRPTSPVTENPIVVDNRTTDNDATIPHSQPTAESTADSIDNTSHSLPTSSGLYAHQYTPLGISKCFIVPAGRDDYLVRIMRIVHLGDVAYARPGEIKFSAPNSSYSPTIGHCVLLQCGWQQYLARVLLKISADDSPNENLFRATDPHVERSLSRILDAASPSPSPPRQLPQNQRSRHTVTVVAPGESDTTVGSPYTPAFSEIGLLRTPANHIVEVRERTQSPESFSDASVAGPVPSPADANPQAKEESRRPDHASQNGDLASNKGEEQHVQEPTRPRSEPDTTVASHYTPAFSKTGLLRTAANHITEVRERPQSPESLSDASVDGPAPFPANANPSANEESRGPGNTNQNVDLLAAQGQEHEQEPAQTPEEEYDSPIDERMASSLEGLHDLHRFESPYVLSRGSSAWNTPMQMPMTPPLAHMQNRPTFSPVETHIRRPLSPPIDRPAAHPFVRSPLGYVRPRTADNQEESPLPSGFVRQDGVFYGLPYAEHDPNPDIPGSPGPIVLYPSSNGSWYYTDRVTGYPRAVAFANDTVVIAGDGQKGSSSQPQPQPHPSNMRRRVRHSATVPLPPTSSAESSPLVHGQAASSRRNHMPSAVAETGG